MTDLSQLLLVTFTKDAARELAEWVRRILTRLATPAERDEEEKYPHVFALRGRLTESGARVRLAQALLDLLKGNWIFMRIGAGRGFKERVPGGNGIKPPARLTGLRTAGQCRTIQSWCRGT